ncbi:hypothetical protein C2E19_12295 [Pseudomonas sp. DTU12.3]|uniref:DUF4225 domain-containing protein n=1 Tax=Pseudomonas sp. DTU12.3 TaxID=2073078 RepID=UPI001010C801|nr:DUF4225 domain-containing protein [Pseudomonas sp. DTU12.3]QAX84596.1 hypothetical protein C2E19_12295 [Pseudomonas sp. DTU12.3]
MNEDSCDINDVIRAASDLVAFGCQIGATQLYDSFRQLRFGEIVSSYANEVIRAVDEGVISAKQGLQELKAEYADLSKKILFYTQNGIGVAAGVMQIQTGTITMAQRRGLNLPLGVAYYAHGINNIYEGLGNIYNGPGKIGVIGPTRQLYQSYLGKTDGNIIYYSADLSLSIIGIFRLIRKTNSTELFIRDPMNYEHAYNQMGKLALAFEALTSSLTIKSMTDKDNKTTPTTN